MERRSRSFLTGDLDQVSTGVVKDARRHRPDLQDVLGEADPECPKPLDLARDVVDREGRDRDPVCNEGFPERDHREVGFRLKERLHPVGVLG